MQLSVRLRPRRDAQTQVLIETPYRNVALLEALLAHLQREGLSKYDMPEYFIAMQAFPLTASGKILKRELAEWTKSGRVQPEAVRWVEPKSADVGSS